MTDSSSSEGPINQRFDAIVVGSGVGGSIAVKELTERGLDVLLLEAGRDLTDDDFVKENLERWLA